MKRITIITALLAIIATHAAAQWSWGGAMYYGQNFHADSIKFNSPVIVNIANNNTLIASRVQSEGNSFSKMGGGRFAIDSVNLRWNDSLIFVGRSDTILLLGTLGAYNGDSIGFFFAGVIKASADTLCRFVINQNDTVTQTFDAFGYVADDRQLLFEQFSDSYTRMVRGMNRLRAAYNIYNGGRAMVEGMYDSRLVNIIDSGVLITGGNSTGGGVRDVTYFDKQRSGYDTLINVASNANLRIGDYPGPSLAKVDGTVKQDGTLEIDVYNPFAAYSLDPVETAQFWTNSFSDRIKIDSGYYTFGANAILDPAFDPAFEPYIEDSLDYWLPVIMFKTTSATNILNPANVTVNQTLPGWALEFAVGTGTGGTVLGWGYLHFSKFIMHKTARLIFINGGLQPEQNGTYPNPIAVMGSDTLLYTIEAINASQHAATLTITDTLPAYMQYINGTAAFLGGATGTITSGTTTSLTPNRDTVQWTLTSIPAGDTVRVSLKAQTAYGSTASQPLYVNTAWVKEGSEMHRRTTGTYHQGAGTSLVVFSAAAGGSIFNAEPQAVEYGYSPRSNELLVVPDDGYMFAGWKHEAYISHRGNEIPAAAGIMDVETLPVRGNVELTACFTPVSYAVKYFLHGGTADNPEIYNVETSDIHLAPPVKDNDVFTGWTGSNGDTPEINAVIPHGSTGERYYYANYLKSGREDSSVDEETDDNIWASDEYLYIRTGTSPCVVRIYSPDGILRHTQTVVGLTKIRLPGGVYIVTLNGNPGRKVFVGIGKR